MDTLSDDGFIFTPSTSWQYRNNKLTESYRTRVSNSTAAWIRKQSPLERFFYVIVLLVLVCLFILIYFSYLHVNEDSNPLEAALIHDQNITNECHKKCDISNYPKQGVKKITTTNISIEKSTIKTSLCSLIGLNHLVTTKPLFNNTRDYYWFRPEPKLPENVNHNSNFDLKDTFSFQDLTKNWSMECAIKKGSFWCKIKFFWESCLKHVNENSMGSYDKLLQKLELKNAVNNLNIDKLLKALEENGQSNGLYYYKPLFVYPNNEKIFLVGRDNYPHYSEESLLNNNSKLFASKLNRLISSNNVTHQEMNEILALDNKLTKLKSLRKPNCSAENECYQYGYYQLHEYRNQFERANKPDYIIEYPNGYIKYLQKHLLKFNLKFYFLWINYKTNMVHINSSSLKSFTEFFGSPNDNSLTSSCRDMLKLPFGLVLLRRMIEMNSNDKLSDLNLSSIILNEITNSFDVSRLGGYKFNNGKLTQLISKLKENIKHLITKERIQFDEYLTALYDQLELTDNYFDNVQAIRKWLRKGYREGCILNLATV
uniref:Uncharacterized protein n=2 Tax=Tetranychus urticae TaxID=32264 RepID=T1K5L6_TETUR